MKPRVPAPVFARLCFLAVASADLDQPGTQLSRESREHLAHEANRAHHDLERLGVTSDHWVQFSRWLRGS